MKFFLALVLLIAALAFVHAHEAHDIDWKDEKHGHDNGRGEVRNDVEHEYTSENPTGAAIVDVSLQHK